MANANEEGSVYLKSYLKSDYFKVEWNIEKFSSIVSNFAKQIRSPHIQLESSSNKSKYEFTFFIQKSKIVWSLMIQNKNSFGVEIRTETLIRKTSGETIIPPFCTSKYVETDSVLPILSFADNIPEILANHTFVITCEMYCDPQIVTKIIPRMPLQKASSIPLKYDFDDFLQNSEYTDITLRASDCTAVRGHKVILSAVSSVFKAMLRSNMQESANSEIFVACLEMPVLKKLLKYIYGGDIQPLTFEEAMDLYYAADKYHVMPLRDVCANVLKLGMSKDNAHDILKLAYDHSDKILYGEALKVLEQNYKDWR